MGFYPKKMRNFFFVLYFMSVFFENSPVSPRRWWNNLSLQKKRIAKVVAGASICSVVVLYFLKKKGAESPGGDQVDTSTNEKKTNHASPLASTSGTDVCLDDCSLEDIFGSQKLLQAAFGQEDKARNIIYRFEMCDYTKQLSLFDLLFQKGLHKKEVVRHVVLQFKTYACSQTCQGLYGYLMSTFEAATGLSSEQNEHIASMCWSGKQIQSAVAVHDFIFLLLHLGDQQQKTMGAIDVLFHRACSRFVANHKAFDYFLERKQLDRKYLRAFIQGFSCMSQEIEKDENGLKKYEGLLRPGQDIERVCKGSINEHIMGSLYKILIHGASVKKEDLKTCKEAMQQEKVKAIATSVHQMLQGAYDADHSPCNLSVGPLAHSTSYQRGVAAHYYFPKKSLLIESDQAFIKT